LLKGWSAEEQTRLNITHAWRREDGQAYPYGGTAVICTAQEPDNENSTVLRVDVTPAAEVDPDPDYPNPDSLVQIYTLVFYGCPISDVFDREWWRYKPEHPCARDFCTCDGDHWRLQLFRTAMDLWIMIVFEVGTIFSFALLLNLFVMVAKEEVINEMIPDDTGSVSLRKKACTHRSRV
jgi:hypothetical protein